MIPVEEVVVTGTHIALPETSFANPVESVTATEISEHGDVNVTDYLANVPALKGSETSALTTAGNNGRAANVVGLNMLNLRDLGTERTLVLVDGLRHVSSDPGTAAVDVSTIPLDLIERVDVLTGGTSAVYGADGVSGVVNFIMRRDFEGIQIHGQAGTSEEGGGGTGFGSILAGRNFADGRVNLTLDYQYSSSARLNETARPYAGNPYDRYELLPAIHPSPGSPQLIPYNNARWQDSSPDAAVDLGSVVNGVFVPGAFDGIPDYTGSGQPYNRGVIPPGSGGQTIGGSGTPVAGYNGDFLPQTRQNNFNILSTFKIAPEAAIHADAQYVRTDSLTQDQPTYDIGTVLAPDNAYLQQRFGSTLSAGGAEITGRDNFDFGPQMNGAVRETLRGVLEVEGTISEHAHYEASYVYGRTTADYTSYNERLADRYYAALDAVVNPANGQITCRINLPGQTTVGPSGNYSGPPVTFNPGQCVPLDILGYGVESPAALDFFLVNVLNTAAITQQVANAFVSGDFGDFMRLPGGSFEYAVGTEYRKESSVSTPSPLLTQGLILDLNSAAPSRGSFDVKEVFGELNLPILKDRPFADVASLGSAIRLSDYSTAGTTTTYNINAVYAPVRDVRFRATYSRAVRAPNISELFAPMASTNASIADPCDIANRTSGSPTRAANCVALLSSLGLTPAEIASFSPSSNPSASFSQVGITGGNSNLRPEVAKTWTAGVVFQPHVIPGLSLTADWYDIKILGAINTFTATQAFDLCVDSPTLSNVFCGLTRRNPTTGFADGFTLAPENVASYTTDGLDLTMNYNFSPRPQWGNFNFRLVGGYLDHLTFVGTPGAAPVESADQPYSPRYLGTATLGWALGRVHATYGLDWQAQTDRYPAATVAGRPNIVAPQYLTYPERWEQHVQVGYDVFDDLNVYAGVNNLWDQRPAFATSATSPFPVSALGRYFYLGLKLMVGVNKR